MGRGVSCGGGQSSLGYLFGSGEAQNAPATPPAENVAPAQKLASPPAENVAPAPKLASPPAENVALAEKPAAAPTNKQIPAGIHRNSGNNYFRADGQNTGNFLTDRPTTKVHAAPGGGSSLDYLFGDGGGK